MQNNNNNIEQNIFLKESFNNVIILEKLDEDYSGSKFKFKLNDDNDDRLGILIFKIRPTIQDASLLIKHSILTLILQNDKYSDFNVKSDTTNMNYFLTTIFPANERDFKSNTSQSKAYFKETWDDYLTYTKPYIEKNAKSIQWVINILEGKSEQDKVMVNDHDEENGFVLLPNFKWDQTKEHLYLLGIPKRTDIVSLRDLTGDHIPLLKHILKTSYDYIDSIDVSTDEIMAFIHYYPSFYHFHIHFAHTSIMPTITSFVGKSILVDDIIDNLSSDPDYYQKKTMFCMQYRDQIPPELLKTKTQ